MDDDNLLEELRQARQRIKELEAADTERRRSEEALQETNANLNALIENTTDYILFSDREGRPVFFNSAYAGIMKEILNLDMRPGIKPHELLPDPEIRAEWDEYHRRVLSGERFTFEFSYPRPHNEDLHVEVSYNPVIKDGEIVGFSEFTRDITQRKQAETVLRQSRDRLEREVAERAGELRESERRLRRAQRMARLANWESDAQTLVSTWSEEAYELLKVDPGLTIDSETFGSLVHPDDREKLIRTVEQTLATGETYDQELRIVCSTGEVIYVHSLAELDHDEAGRPTKLVGTMQDITDRKQAEEERHRLERQVLQAQKLESLGVLTGGIAHDFNNLLMAIVGNADLALLELSQDSEVWANIQAIIETALKASQLTSQMLAYAGKGRFQVQTHDLNSIISKMGHLLKSSVSKKSTVTYQLTTGIPSIAADAAQLRQIVLNLVINADEALDQMSGQICVKTSARRLTQEELESLMCFETLPQGKYVVMEVTDSGCGMDEETKAKVFDPFFTTKFAGRGLGLAAVHGIVRGSGGALEVISEPGRGATFRVFFRALDRAISRPPVEVEPTTPWRGRGLVLLVDDEAPVRSAAQQMLERIGFDVIVASDGVEGIELFRQRTDDIVCVLLDLQMPKMNGEETFDEIRALREGTPVVLSSGYGEEEAVQRFAGRGLADFIQKPYRLAALEEKLRKVLGAIQRN